MEDGIRQGNQNKKVHIFTYVTEQTFDAYLYQIVETKQKFIAQIMTSRTPVRSAEDVDEKALSYGEIKALATGNPNILKKTQLDSDVSKLKLLKQNYLGQIYELEDKIAKSYPKRINELEEKLTAYNTDLKVLQENDKPNADGFSKMILNGVEYTEKEKAGQTLLNICSKKTNADIEEIGEYKGFKLELSFNGLEKEFVITMKNRMSYNIDLGSDVYGNIKRIDNKISNIPEFIKNIELELEDTKKQLETAKVEVQKPFIKEQELQDKLKELDEINISLNINEKDKQVLDTSKDEENKEEKDKNKDYER